MRESMYTIIQPGNHNRPQQITPYSLFKSCCVISENTGIPGHGIFLLECGTRLLHIKLHLENLLEGVPMQAWNLDIRHESSHKYSGEQVLACLRKESWHVLSLHACGTAKGGHGVGAPPLIHASTTSSLKQISASPTVVKSALWMTSEPCTAAMQISRRSTVNHTSSPDPKQIVVTSEEQGSVTIW